MKKSPSLSRNCCVLVEAVENFVNIILFFIRNVENVWFLIVLAKEMLKILYFFLVIVRKLRFYTIWLIFFRNKYFVSFWKVTIRNPEIFLLHNLIKTEKFNWRNNSSFWRNCVSIEVLEKCWIFYCFSEISTDNFRLSIFKIRFYKKNEKSCEFLYEKIFFLI